MNNSFEYIIKRNKTYRNILEEIAQKTRIPINQFIELYPSQENLEELQTFKKYLDNLTNKDLKDLYEIFKNNYSAKCLKSLFDKFPNPKDFQIFVERANISSKNETANPLPLNQVENFLPSERLEQMKKKSISYIEGNIQKIAQNTSKAVQEIIEETKKHPFIAIGTLLTTAALLISLKNSPTLKINNQIDELKSTVATSFEETGIAKQTNSFITNVTLKESASNIIKKLNISKDDHMRLYILSLAISDSDFYTIIEELGYGSYGNYLRTIGYKNQGTKRAEQQYQEDFFQNLQNILQKLNDNPKLIPEYLNNIPELMGLFQIENTPENGYTYFIIENSHEQPTIKH